MSKIAKFIKSNWLVAGYLVLIALTLLYIFSYNRGHQTAVFNSSQGSVIEVVDGDTFKLLSGESVRLLSINAPEKGDPYSVEATDKLRDLVLDKDVELKFDQEKEDYYGRLLAYVYINNTFVNEVMVSEGLAWSYIVPPNDMYQYEIELAESEAKQARIGLWSNLK